MLTFIHLTALTLAASVSTMLTEYTPVNHSLGGSPAQMTPTYTIMHHDVAKVADSDATDVKSDVKSDVTDMKSDAKAGTDSTKDITADDIAKDVTSGATDDVDAISKDAAKVATTDGTGIKEGSDGTGTKDGSHGGDEEAKPIGDASSG